MYTNFQLLMANVISVNGGWNEGYNIAVQDKDGTVLFMQVFGKSVIVYGEEEGKWYFTCVDHKTAKDYTILCKSYLIDGHATEQLTNDQYAAIMAELGVEKKPQKETNMTTEVPNEEMKKFIELSDADKIAIINAKFNGDAQYTMTLNGMWVDCLNTSSIDFNIAYRTKPVKKLDIPWNIIAPVFNYAAMDESGEVWLFEIEPKATKVQWVVAEFEGEFECASRVFVLDVTGIDWKTSLTKRP